MTHKQRTEIEDTFGQRTADAVAPAARGAQPLLTSLRGQVSSADGGFVGGALVRLVGGEEALGADPRAVANSRGTVTWTRPLTGYAGALWNCWQRHVAPVVAGITWEEFRREAAHYNPALRDTDDRMRAGEVYYLPENRIYADTRASMPAIRWDQLLTGFTGDLWACWQRYVQGKVVGLEWTAFRAEMVAHNPDLVAGDARLQDDRAYVLPRNAGQHEYVRIAFSGSDGRFTFENLRPGVYRIEISAAGYRRWEQTISLGSGDAAVTCPLEPIFIEVERGDSFVRPAGRHFAVEGRKFRFIGVNLRGLAHYGLSNPVRGANAADQLQSARSMGARVARIFLPHAEVSAADTRLRLINLLKLMEERFPDMYLIIALANLYSDVEFRVPGDDPFYTHEPAGGGRKLLNIDWFREGYRANYLPFVQTILQDEIIRNSPRILAYNIGNELKAEARDGDRNIGHPALLVDFMHAMARQMRQWDGGRHMITTGMISTRHAHMQGYDNLRMSLYDIRELDFITNHSYHGDDDPATDWDRENEAASREDDSDIAGRLPKPLLIEEAGFLPTEQRKDRSAWVERELRTLLDEKEAVGYMPWGFMEGFDNGDGDNALGLDHIWHDADWHPLRGQYQRRAADLAADAPELRPPSTTFFVGQQVFTQTTVRLRADAGQQAVVLQKVPGRVRVTITGPARQLDGLTWWPVSANPESGAVQGWMAQADPYGQVLLSEV